MPYWALAVCVMMILITIVQPTVMVSLVASPDSIEEIRLSNLNYSDFLFPSNSDFLSFSSLIRTLFFSQHAMQIHSEILPYQLLFS